MRAMLAAGELDDRKVELTIEQKAVPMMFTGMGMEQIDFDLQGMFEKILPKNTSRREMTRRRGPASALRAGVRGAHQPGEGQRRGDRAGREPGHHLPRRDRQDRGQRDARGPTSRGRACSAICLPIVEGTTVQTRYGYVRTDHVLFIAAGAFHRAKPSDLMPELQGRFPIRVELTDLTKDDFVRILTEPKSALTKQYTALLETEGVDAANSRPTPSTPWPTTPSR